MAVRSAAAGEAEVDFDGVIDEANRRLRGDDEIVGVETEELRDRLLAGFEYVLVDEYQDIDERQYELVTHVARRPGQDGDERATILAVGDDDQTIYEWRTANVEFLRRFEADYGAERCYLAENYRSTGNIVEAANALIGHNRDRMKTGQPIRVDRARADDPPGGGWEKRDGIARGGSRCSRWRVRRRRRGPCSRRSSGSGASTRTRTGRRSPCLAAGAANCRPCAPPGGERGTDPLGAAAKAAAAAHAGARVPSASVVARGDGDRGCGRGGRA